VLIYSTFMVAVRVVDPALLAEIVILLLPLVTANVVTVKVPVVEPSATVIVARTVAIEVLLLDKLTANPPVGAAPERVTVPVDVAGRITVVGFSVRLDRVGGFTVRVALWFPPPINVAEMCTAVAEATGWLVTVNVVALLPDGTVTVVTDRLAAATLSLATLTTTPPLGAVVFKVTFAVDVAPPRTLVGLRLTEEIAGGLIVSAAVCCTPL
jgi:hypothetical protein